MTKSTQSSSQKTRRNQTTYKAKAEMGEWY